MNNKLNLVAIFGALAVGIGAFGAHGLKPLLSLEQIETFKTASFYHFVHLMPMLMIALKQNDHRVFKQCFYLFFIGVLCFSGSLYIISTKHLLGGDIWNFMGPVTPIGGLFLILGWLNFLRVR
jgi:uncharacterized membrane protein YgdD (TMEM256/DUF423 family)